MPPSASTWRRKADFVGAIRLPSDAFKREGTAVVTDIVFLRKRAPDEPARHADPDWLGVAPLAIEGVEVPINRYFLNHPGDGAGHLEPQGHALRGEGYSVTGNGDLAEQLQDAIDRLPRIRAARKQLRVREPARPGLHAAAARAAHRRRQLLRRRRPHHLPDASTGRPCPSSTAARRCRADGTLTGKRLAALIGLRDLRPPRPAIAERRLARERPRRGPPGTQLGL